MRNKKLYFILILAAFVIFSQKLGFDVLEPKSVSLPGQVAGSQQTASPFSVSFFNIGEADSIFIQLPTHKKILIDGGEQDGQALKKIKAVMGGKNNYLDLVISTHPHADHLGGLIDILKNYQVGQVWLTGVVHSSATYLNFLKLLKTKKISTRIVYSCGLLPGQSGYTALQIDNLSALDKQHCLDELVINPEINLRILYPLKNLKGQSIKNLNNSSIVTKLNYKQVSFLFMGDAEIPSEEKILSVFPEQQLKADVLKIAHQGSSDASSQQFLIKVKPTYAVILTGRHNSYGHPSLRIIRRLERLGIKILRTDKDGDIVFISDGQKITLLK